MHSPLTKTTTPHLSQPPGRHQRGRWATLIREVQEGIVRSTRGDRSESESPTDPAQPKPARKRGNGETKKRKNQKTKKRKNERTPGPEPRRKKGGTAVPPRRHGIT